MWKANEMKADCGAIFIETQKITIVAINNIMFMMCS